MEERQQIATIQCQQESRGLIINIDRCNNATAAYVAPCVCSVLLKGSNVLRIYCGYVIVLPSLVRPGGLGTALGHHSKGDDSERGTTENMAHSMLKLSS